MINHSSYIQRCFDLALNALGTAAPNPLVGCVIVKDDKILAEGYHRCCGGAHAEVEAIAQANAKGVNIEGATLYVNLEPCSHHGKNPPCCDLIVGKKLGKVVVSNGDPNPLVSGRGIKCLRDAGIEVVQNILEEEGFELNRRFFTSMIQKRPYIILKWAQTQDGFMDIERNPETPSTQTYWISNPQLKTLVHKWRSEEAAILVGTQTAQNDNPQLNLRLWHGRHPLRLVLDRRQSLSGNLHLFDQSQPTVVFTDISQPLVEKENLCFQPVNFENLLPEMMDFLFKNNIQSLIVEGGKRLLESFIAHNLWDEARVITGDKHFLEGLSAPRLPLLPSETYLVKGNRLDFYRNKK